LASVAKRSNSLSTRLHSDGVYAEQSVHDCVLDRNSQMSNSRDITENAACVTGTITMVFSHNQSKMYMFKKSVIFCYC